MGGPLAGVRVVELAGLGPAPHGAMVLADLGADVVRVVRPDAGPGLLPADGDLLLRDSLSATTSSIDPPPKSATRFIGNRGGSPGRAMAANEPVTDR